MYWYDILVLRNSETVYFWQTIANICFENFTFFYILRFLKSISINTKESKTFFLIHSHLMCLFISAVIYSSLENDWKSFFFPNSYFNGRLKQISNVLVFWNVQTKINEQVLSISNMVWSRICIIPPLFLLLFFNFVLSLNNLIWFFISFSCLLQQSPWYAAAAAAAWARGKKCPSALLIMYFGFCAQSKAIMRVGIISPHSGACHRC